MGDPSGCKVSVPFTLLDFPSWVCSVLAALATHPPPEDSISSSSCPTDLPSRRIFNLPFSCANAAAEAGFFCAGAAERTEARVKIQNTSFQRINCSGWASWREMLSHLRVADFRPPNEFRNRYPEFQRCRGGGFRPPPHPHPRNYPHGSRPVDRRATAEREERENWLHHGTAGGRSWSCNERAAHPWRHPAK